MENLHWQILVRLFQVNEGDPMAPGKRTWSIAASNPFIRNLKSGLKERSVIEARVEKYNYITDLLVLVTCRVV